MRRRSKGRSHSKAAEDREDAALLAESETNNTHRLTVQPSCIKFGIMREYQLQGLNWMIHLYDNGINGILADEMVGLPQPSGGAACQVHLRCHCQRNRFVPTAQLPSPLFLAQELHDGSI